MTYMYAHRPLRVHAHCDNTLKGFFTCRLSWCPIFVYYIARALEFVAGQTQGNPVPNYLQVQSKNTLVQAIILSLVILNTFACAAWLVVD